MPTQRTDDLVALINSMSKAEKRSFKLFVTRNQNAASDILFLQLFDEINKKRAYKEAEVLANIPGIKKRQLSNLKAHLYKQILISLRTLPTDVPDQFIREAINNSEILYSKGLYRQALESLSKAKEKALQYHQYDYALVIINKEKYIESQHITHAHPNRVESLSKQAFEIVDQLNLIKTLTDLSLTLYASYLNSGYVKSEKQARKLQTLFRAQVDIVGEEVEGFYPKLYLNQSYAWFYYIMQDFANYYKHCLRWMHTFEEYPHMLEIEMPLFIKGIHNTLTSLFMANAPHKFDEHFTHLDKLIHSDQKMSWNVQGLVHLFYYTHLLNGHMMKGDFSNCILRIENLEKLLKKNTYNWDDYRIMVFYYKIACVYFGAGEYGKSIDFLNKIINQKASDLRTDIQCYARILALIAHYELGSRKLLEYQVKSVYRFLSKMGELQKVQQAVFRFVRKIPNMKPLEVKTHFKNLHNELLEIASDPFENRSFLYLDIISWLESKLENRSVEEVVSQKYSIKHKEVTEPIS